MSDPQQTLLGFRARIDAIDEAMAKLLVERIGVIGEVAALKGAHWPGSNHIRPGREGQMHRAIAARFAGTGMPVLGALAIWRQLIGASTHLESPLNAVFLAAHPAHGWLAREYFGMQVGMDAATDFAAAVARMARGESNLLILPSPTASDWWRDAAALQAAGLFIFASLPVAEGVLPDGMAPAVALAPVAPEDSGDDISYFVRDGQLAVVDGFVSQREGAIFLGAHPRPIVVENDHD